MCRSSLQIQWKRIKTSLLRLLTLHGKCRGFHISGLTPSEFLARNVSMIWILDRESLRCEATSGSCYFLSASLPCIAQYLKVENNYLFPFVFHISCRGKTYILSVLLFKIYVLTCYGWWPCIHLRYKRSCFLCNFCSFFCYIRVQFFLRYFTFEA